MLFTNEKQPLHSHKKHENKCHYEHLPLQIDFDRSVNPISTRAGVDGGYIMPTTLLLPPPWFSDLPTALHIGICIDSYLVKNTPTYTYLDEKANFNV